MYLSSIDLTNFKNHKSFNCQFDEKINCFSGDNGVGKTNILDAIYYLCTCKSYFSGSDSQNINHEEEYFMIKGTFMGKGTESDIQCTVEKSKKKTVKNNNKVYKKLIDHIGKFPIVVVAPNDISLILEGSSERRKFIDSCISQYDKQYLSYLVKYNKIILQRNTLLKNFAKHRVFEPASLEIWDEQLIEPCNYIFEKRKEFVNYINPIFEKSYNNISGQENEKVNIEYKSKLNESSFEDLLRENLERDRILQYTSVGIHKDDLDLKLNNHPIKKHGSQGQTKTFLIALKFAQFDILKSSLSYKPILLLDDIFDKLDKSRVQNIVKLVSQEHFKQIFITDTNKERLLSILSNTIISNKIFEL